MDEYCWKVYEEKNQAYLAAFAITDSQSFWPFYFQLLFFNCFFLFLFWLIDSGVHGALVVLEPSFTADTMSTALGIPQSKNIIRRHLATELESLVNPAR